MSKPVKELVRKELINRFDGVSSLAVVGFSGISAVNTRKIRGQLREKEISMTVVKNSIARQAFKEVGLDSAVGLLDGPCAIAYGADSVVSVVRELLDIRKTEKNLTVKAAVLDGDIFGEDRINELSKFPTREEAISQVLGCILSAGSSLSGCLVGPASQLAGLVKAVEEKAGGDSSEEAA